MRAAPPLLSFLLILLHHSGWTHGLCHLTKADSDVLYKDAQCDQLKDFEKIETYDRIVSLKAPGAQDVLVPDFFSNLTDLKHLDLSGGDLRTIRSGSFRGLSNLRSLNLTDNRIEYLELGSVEGLTHLRSLKLRKNAIRQLPAALARLKNLKHLDIHDNPLECNCATLNVRDLLIRKKNVSFKNVLCANPAHMKDTLITTWNATVICNFERQDREMQNDQPEGSGTDPGFDDIPDDLSEEEDEDDEYKEVSNSLPEKPKELEIETPFPTSVETTSASPVIVSTASTKETSVSTEETTDTTVNSLQSTGDDGEIFFDNEDKKEQATTTEMSQNKIKDSLFYPSEGSADGDEGSGEGSGIWRLGDDEEKTVKESTSGDSLETSFLDLIFGNWGGTSTPIPSETKDPDLEEEQFINVSSTTEETIAESSSRVTTDATTSISITNGVEVLQSGSGDKSRSGNVKAEVNSLNDENAAVSTSKQSKKGMGSYIVLAILLAVVAALIGIAAYRGDICRKKRKRSDVENGTELKDMQKSLLPDGNSTQPKIASNGNAESIPLVDGAPDGDDAKIDKIRSNDRQTQDAPQQSVNGTADHSDPVKPPRKQIASQDESVVNRPRVLDINSLRENFLADMTSPTHPSESSIATNNEPNGPPLSPGAQRVKITLQENPDSVPKTPILITRTIAGENLVKTS
ncbi:uncharacterized protein LOC109863792 isoform X2 [Pseudomyrmex gracilis]|nr:uncharacterized protein LOC109863792 isoform X2 [Pseudomyrmex gracilis]XP_020299942.1 uncharacterized protein LOC109863792 isoform X2 [Pseudomyrmex gracilis]XP_020299943.1 uncharacterized protein LOC109863792 isoform X2 [Pseudomyrmex gracilis]